MIEQPPFTLKAAYKQRERWVFGAMQALAHIRQQPDWMRLSRKDRWHINVVIRLRVLTYALGFPVSLLALGSNVVILLILATEAVREGTITVVAPELTVYGIITSIGLVLWMAGTQLGLFYNLRYTGMTRLQKLRDHVLVLIVTPFAGVIDTAGPLVAVLKWLEGIREVAWKPTPKLAAAPKQQPKRVAAAEVAAGEKAA